MALWTIEEVTIIISRDGRLQLVRDNIEGFEEEETLSVKSDTSSVTSSVLWLLLLKMQN